ncbi:unnamed protein product [Rotaria socialis]|uniref:G-protein coupled receptors family 1 profile domain-containing protein n=1 Tax=Rotaria socialis TaxID=392032 RepID=A0A820P528_9BILA|nr:unnamed protein product [Rotaria socialis]CAF3764220.1 unnamed protein product [Rotaria socialis]CAF4401131.1 unnamed protein product [Rotaria socialis]CAF4739666.1 unnamed protein product [Rotaria socialis]
MNETTGSSEPPIVRHIKFYLFISIELPSVSISIYIFYKFYHSYEIRSRINNHSILALLVVSFIALTTELPITLQYHSSGHVKPEDERFCLFWIWYNYSLKAIDLFLMAWTSIERHILIFHSYLVLTSIGKLKWHYIPLVISFVYVPLFYFLCVTIYPCENNFDYSSHLCRSICFHKITWLSTFDWITNILLPSLIIEFGSITLLIRILIQFKKMKRTIKWQATRKMTLQLISISSLYSIFWISFTLISVIRLFFIPEFLDKMTLYYFHYSPYFVQLLMPCMCLFCLPELWTSKNRVVPTQ